MVAFFAIGWLRLGSAMSICLDKRLKMKRNQENEIPMYGTVFKVPDIKRLDKWRTDACSAEFLLRSLFSLNYVDSLCASQQLFHCGTNVACIEMAPYWPESEQDDVGQIEREPKG